MKLIRNLNLKVLAMTGLLAPFVANLAHASEHGGGGIGELGAALAIGIAAFGGALGQGKTASAALEGIARNPQANLLTPMILGLALIESLVLFAFAIAFVKY